MEEERALKRIKETMRKKEAFTKARILHEKDNHSIIMTN
jgi:hypothetical protein